MNTLDDEIRDALRAAPDDASLHGAGDEGMLQQFAATFRGRMRFWVFLIWGATAMWTGVCVWSAVGFFRATDTRDWVMYAAIFLFAGMAVAMLKMWCWMEMNRNTHSREIKRLEMQVARLAERRA